MTETNTYYEQLMLEAANVKTREEAAALLEKVRLLEQLDDSLGGISLDTRK